LAQRGFGPLVHTVDGNLLAEALAQPDDLDRDVVGHFGWEVTREEGVDHKRRRTAQGQYEGDGRVQALAFADPASDEQHLRRRQQNPVER
jgi:hypothetical protein